MIINKKFLHRIFYKGLLLWIIIYSKKNYFIKDNRLYYKYKHNNIIKEKKIPYKYEVPIILYNAHVQEFHVCYNKSKNILNEGEYYFERITSELKKYITECPKCNALKNLKTVNVPEKVVLNEGPRYEIQLDIWYLPPDIKLETDYKFVLDIVDHFSKWIWSYPLKTKRAEDTLRCLKSFIMSFGLVKKIHTDNGLEFHNTLFDNYCTENNIIHSYSKPYTPKSAGAVEAAHKQIKKLVFDQYYTEKENDREFNLEDALLNSINFHNNNIHSITGFKPVDLKDIEDINIINQVKENIKKCFKSIEI